MIKGVSRTLFMIFKRKPKRTIVYEAQIRLALTVLFTLNLNSCSAPRNKSIPTIHSSFVQDDFELYIDVPPAYSSQENYSVVFYMDANLNMGNELRRQIKLDDNKENLKNVIFVGVGHIGNYRKLRRRDFIPPVYTGGEVVASKDPDYGHADDFYNFLSSELIPYVNQNYPNNGRHSFIGHSFSGLFAFYCLMKSEVLFVNHIALSPSLWVNYDNFFEIEKTLYKDNKKLNTSLYHASGSLEWANKVLHSSRNMRDIIEGRSYPGLIYKYVEHQEKGHNGVVAVSLEHILRHSNF